MAICSLIIFHCNSAIICSCRSIRKNNICPGLIMRSTQFCSKFHRLQNALSFQTPWCMETPVCKVLKRFHSPFVAVCTSVAIISPRVVVSFITHKSLFLVLMLLCSFDVAAGFLVKHMSPHNPSTPWTYVLDGTAHALFPASVLHTRSCMQVCHQRHCRHGEGNITLNVLLTSGTLSKLPLVQHHSLSVIVA